jgi:hypothetical protein
MITHRHRYALLVRLAVAAPLAACGASHGQQQAAAPAPSAYGGGPLSTLETAGAEAAGPLVSSVSSAVPGLSPTQAATGTGALLGLAKQKMPGDQFGQISQSLPGTDALIAGAQKQGLPSSGLSDRSSLSGVFRSAGISPTQEALLVPAVQSEVSKAAGPAVAEAFAAAVK